MAQLKTIIQSLRYWPYVLCGVFYLYLIGHAFTGRQGMMRWIDYKKDMTRLNTELASLEAQRELLERRAIQLSSDNLDMDVIDVSLRETLYYSHTKEMTFWLDD